MSKGSRSGYFQARPTLPKVSWSIRQSKYLIIVENRLKEKIKVFQTRQMVFLVTLIIVIKTDPPFDITV